MTLNILDFKTNVISVKVVDLDVNAEHEEKHDEYGIWPLLSPFPSLLSSSSHKAPTIRKRFQDIVLLSTASLLLISTNNRKNNRIIVDAIRLLRRIFCPIGRHLLDKRTVMQGHFLKAALKMQISI